MAVPSPTVAVFPLLYVAVSVFLVLERGSCTLVVLAAAIVGVDFCETLLRVLYTVTFVVAVHVVPLAPVCVAVTVISLL